MIVVIKLINLYITSGINPFISGMDISNLLLANYSIQCYIFNYSHHFKVFISDQILSLTRSMFIFI